MTNLEMQLRLEQRLSQHLDKQLDLRTIDIEYFLNEGLRRFIEFYYSLFERDEAARKRLNKLVVTDTIARTDEPTPVTTDAHPNGEFWTLPTDILYVVSEEAITNLIPSGTHRCEVKPVKIDFYNKHINNSFKKPYKNLVWRLDIGASAKRHELIVGAGTTNVQTYFVTYVKQPAKIALLSGTPETTSCDISQEFHEEVIDRALQVSLEMLQLSGRIKTNENTEN